MEYKMKNHKKKIWTWKPSIVERRLYFLECVRVYTNMDFPLKS